MTGLVRRFILAATALAAAAVVAGCTSNTSTAAPMCPEILIPADTAKLTRFKPGPGRDIIDVLHEEQVTGFAHRCTYDTDKTGAGEVAVEVAPAFESHLGPTNGTRVAEFQYFVAIADKDKNIRDKARFPVSITFPANMSRVRWQREEPILMRIPLQPGESGTDYKVFLGLQLTPEELDHQRRAK